MNVEETGEKSENQKHFFEEMSKKYKILTVFGYTEPVPEERLKEHPDWNHYYNRLGIAENGELKLNYAEEFIHFLMDLRGSTIRAAES